MLEELRKLRKNTAMKSFNLYKNRAAFIL